MLHNILCFLASLAVGGGLAHYSARSVRPVIRFYIWLAGFFLFILIGVSL